MLFIIVLITKLISEISKSLNLGSGSTWPGHIALKLDKNIIKKLTKKSNIQIVFVAGTNGKTTTTSLVKTILEEDGKTVIQNNSGANLINGIASTLLLNSDNLGEIAADYAIFEVDENVLPLALLELTPDYLVLLNLFRDQLDRYGEINSIAKKWRSSLVMLPKTTTLILNADDPQIAFLGKHFKGDALYFGLLDKKLEDKNMQHAADSTYCPNCGNKLDYKTVYFSHLGDYFCKHCNFKRPLIDIKNAYYPLPGIYNMYNTLAAVLTTKIIGIDDKTTNSALQNFTPAFGRQEKITYHGKTLQLFLSKNPTSFNQSLKTIIDLGAEAILIVLNDRVPDGRDISWIWDTDIEPYVNKLKHIIISGDRCYDMGLRFQYAITSTHHPELVSKSSEEQKKFQILEKLDDAVHAAFEKINDKQTLYILPTYSAMLDVRKILTGKKIL